MKENEESCNILYFKWDLQNKLLFIMCTKADKVLWYSHRVGGELSNSIYSQLMATLFKWENEKICGGF